MQNESKAECVGSDGYEISSDRSRLDVGLIYDFLRSTSWAQDIPRSVVERSINHSLCFGAFHRSSQVGFARVVTDFATIGYIGDLFVLPGHRGRGVAKMLMGAILAHPELQGLRRLLLATQDAHGLYSQFGFRSLQNPEHYMTIHNPDVHRGKAST
jgi:GNAT superfamily N-acetyltransferase